MIDTADKPGSSTAAQMRRFAALEDILIGFSDGIDGDRLQAGLMWAKTGRADWQRKDLIGLFASPWQAAAEEAGWQGDALAEGEKDLDEVTAAALTADPVDAFLDEVRAELIRARAKFPGDRIMTLAMTEEAGELVKAVLDEPARNVRKEAVQTAAMAARIVLDGDGSVNEWRAAKGLDPLTSGAGGMTAAIEIGATLRHHDGRTGTFVCIESDGRYRTQSFKGKGYWIFHPDDCERISSPTTSSTAPAALRAAISDIAAERERQINSEGWTSKHDDKYATGEMALAAACYALSAGDHEDAPAVLEAAMFDCWPWSRSWWKPTDPRRDLVKAGALIVAEIERIDRQSLAAPQTNQKGDA